MSLVLGIRRGGYLMLLSDRRTSQVQNIHKNLHEVTCLNDEDSKVYAFSAGYISGSGETVLIDYLVENVQAACLQKGVGLGLATCLADAVKRRNQEGLPKAFLICCIIVVIHNGTTLEMHSVSYDGTHATSERMEPESFEASLFAGFPDSQDFYRNAVFGQKTRHEFDNERSYIDYLAQWARSWMRWQLSFDPSISPMFDFLVLNERTCQGRTMTIDAGQEYGFELGSTYRRDLLYTPHGVFVTLEAAKAAQALIEQRQKMNETKPVASGRVVKWTLQDIQNLQNPLYKIVK